MDPTTLLAAARGDILSDLAFRNGRVVNVFTAEIEEVDVVVRGSRIAGLGAGYQAHAVVDLQGRFLVPGLIDSHVHIESSMVTPAEFARAVIPRGTTTVITDPHEIANVHGLEGIRYMLDASEGLPLTVLVMASSCVPATPMSTAGASLDAQALTQLLPHPRVLGLAEVMNFPGVIGGAPEVMAKLEAFAGRVVDGHAPGVRGHALNAYIAGGPSTDHESTRPEEASEKLRRGLFLLLREATNARNLLDLLPGVPAGARSRVALCTDDRQPADLLDEGGIDAMIRMLIREGIPPVEAIRMATLNPVQHYGLVDRGAIAPGRRADLLVVSDLDSFEVEEVYAGGKKVAEGGLPLEWTRPAPPSPPPPSMNVVVSRERLRIPAREGRLRVIGVTPDQLVTTSQLATPTVAGGEVVPDPERDLLKIVVAERHTGSGRLAIGMVRGFGFRKGAIAGTVAHDHHNLIAVGADDDSLGAAMQRVADLQGGLAVAAGGAVRAELPLPVGGLMSPEPIESVRARLDRLLGEARALGGSLHDPFMAMSFAALEVIPSLKITDWGLVDVEGFQLVDLWE